MGEGGGGTLPDDFFVKIPEPEDATDVAISSPTEKDFDDGRSLSKGFM